MVETPIARSPLAHLIESEKPAGGAVSLTEHPFRGLIDLRLDPAKAEARGAAEAALGLALPREPNRVTEGDGRSALWLGPDEFLIVTTDGAEAELSQRLSQALANHHAAVTDVSDGRTIIEVKGPRARDVIAKGCGLDLHPRAFGPGQCAQSGLAKARILIRQRDAAPTYDVFVERSHAEYLWLWLNDAAAEYLI